MRWGATHDETYVAFGEVLLDIDHSLLEELVVAEVGVGEIVYRGEEGDYGEVECVRDGYGEVEGWVVEGALAALHPVDDALAVFRWRAAFANSGACVQQCCDFAWEFGRFPFVVLVGF